MGSYMSFPYYAAICLTAAFAWSLGFSERRTKRYDPNVRTHLVEPLLLPIMLVELVLLYMLLNNRWAIDTGFLLEIARLGLQAAIYFSLVTLATPLLRRFLGSQARAALWLMPNILYLLLMVEQITPNTPLIRIPLSRNWLQPLLLLWGLGAAGVMGWHLISHFRFRTTLLDSAVPYLEDPAQKMWYQACTEHKVRTDIPLMWSAQIDTPLSIGCFQRTMVLVLPEKRYTPEELELIFRHELRHIKRADMRTKIWMALWKAVFWFLPTVWIAGIWAAEDLELCCDEEVLAGADKAQRRRYAELLLDSAAPAAGFSTCLSADAKALGRRIRQVISPVKRLSGGIILFFAAAVLTLTAPQVAFEITDTTLREVLGSVELGHLSTASALLPDSGISGPPDSGITDYLLDLPCRAVPYAPEGNGQSGQLLSLSYSVRAPESAPYATLFVSTDHLILQMPTVTRISYFVLEEPVDWNIIRRFFPE